MTFNQPLHINTEAHRLELRVDDHMAFIDYKLTGTNLFLIHTEVPSELEGRGVAAALVTKAFEYAKENNLVIVPLCPYVQAWLKRHPEWHSLVSPDAERFMKHL